MDNTPEQKPPEKTPGFGQDKPPNRTIFLQH